MADLKLIAEGIDLYTIDQATSEAAGFEMEFMQDRKLATSWKATTSGTQNIDVDMGANSSGLEYVFFYHNISDNSSSAEINIFEEDENDGTWDGTYTQRGSTFIITPSNTPYAFIDLGSTYSNRYWRLQMAVNDAAPEVFLIFMGTDSSALTGITVRYMFGQLEEPIYNGSKIVETLGGMRYARQYHDGRERFEYAWDHLDATNEARLQAVIALSKGSALPFFMQLILDTSPLQYRYVRLMNSGIGARQVAHTLFNTGRLIFEEEL